MSRFSNIFQANKPIIGMIHLAPLPDYPQSPGIERVVEQALRDLQVLQQAGFDGVLVENEYDRPHRVEASPETISAMQKVTTAVVSESSIVVGCEILLNDPKASLDVAKKSGAKFVRTDYFVDAMTRPEYGEFSIDPEELMNYRSSINATSVLIFADIQVKYATMIEPRPLTDSARLACIKLADAVIVTGDASGNSPTVKQLREATAGVIESGREVPVLIGSGLDEENAQELLTHCSGAIVGTSIMRDKSVDSGVARSLIMQTRSNGQ